MKYKIFMIIVGAVLFLAPIGTASANGLEYEYSAGQAVISTPDFVVKVTSAGNVPQYHFWALGDDENDAYKVKFVSMFEFEDVDDDGAYQPQNDTKDASSQVTFPSGTWSFSGFNVETINDTVMAVHFNFTHDNTPYIQLRNHIYANATDRLKFDIIIDDYTWHNTTNNVKLAFKIQFSGHKQVRARAQNQYTIGQGSFGYKSTAQGDANNSAVNVYSHMEGNDEIYLSYDYFGESLVHDPEVSLLDSDSEENSIDTLFLIGGALFLGLIALTTRKRE